MPATFPETDFRAFGLAASTFFPSVISDEALFDPQEKRTQFGWAWATVRYRYCTCAECNDEFKALVNNASERWRAGWGDEELTTYKLQRCIYEFFMNALSVFESFGFCLYFLGGALRPDSFLDVKKPWKITLARTGGAYTVAFPEAAITASLATLLKKGELTTIEEVRNLLAHRLTGRRSVRVWSDGTTHTREETWHIPGSPEELKFDENMLQGQMDEMTDMLTTLTVAAREFAEGQKPATVLP